MKKEWQERFGVGLSRLGCFLLDTAVMAVAYLTAFILRFDFAEPHWGWGGVARSFITVWAVQMVALWLFGCRRLLWRYVSVGDVPQFVCAGFFSTLVLVLLRMTLPGHQSLRPPYSITFFNSFLVTGGLLGVRLLWRLMVEGFSGAREEVSPKGTRTARRVRRVLLVGAGEAGNLVARELKRQGGRRQRVVGFLDDDPAKRHARIQGFPVVGEIRDLPKAAHKYAVDEVVIAMVRVPRNVIRRVVRLCERAHVPARIVPGYYELIEGSLTASKIRDIDVSDLLGREEATTDSGPVVSLFTQKRVLITGAGGSIGSELVRQVLRTGPGLLVLVDRSENALYEIEREIRKLGVATPVQAVLADVGDARRMQMVFRQVKPQLVVHSAAHKHVPLMEQNPVEAVKNNVLATRALGELAVACGTERFVLISTDKAVKPISVMGMTKRLAEAALQELNTRGQTRFSAVRFGNVLGSSGSVVPLFREQIRKGEAVTVTHPEMRRYFMTIAEAVALVLQAMALAEGGEVFVLDMGEPVRIVELAEEMIALSGLRPYEDIPIVFTSIRPGEKLFEELDVSERSAYKTGHAQIFVSKTAPADTARVEGVLAACRRMVEKEAGADEVREALQEMVRDIGKDVS
ncbi:MAG TPA: nucleoside-diphosphate sugar epimerase/dehydratase [Kiritimatiellia bacterium]|jgi:FlaA1/EpsC-like NDP-sugar epimerase|nr:nucleoside-diphosphate sugar epimerase/dehydratase [Kiritimatiellia bacterium]